MHRLHIRVFAPAILLSIASCNLATPKPTVDETTRAIKEFYDAQYTVVRDVNVVRFGESGKADFAAPGSQDLYWAVEFDIPPQSVAKRGSKKRSLMRDHGVANIYRTKIGQWKVAQIEQ